MCVAPPGGNYNVDESDPHPLTGRLVIYTELLKEPDTFLLASNS